MKELFIRLLLTGIVIFLNILPNNHNGYLVKMHDHIHIYLKMSKHIIFAIPPYNHYGYLMKMQKHINTYL